MKKIVIIAFITVTFLITACKQSKITVPTSDNTPPVLTWNVYDKGTKVGKDYPGTPTVSLPKYKLGQQLVFTLRAKDSEGGIKSISLGCSRFDTNCVQPGSSEQVESSAPSFTPPPTSILLEPDGNSMVETNAFLMQFWDDIKSDCPDGTHLIQYGVNLKGEATNYLGGTTQSILLFGIYP